MRPQTSALVKRFYEALVSGEEFQDDSWKAWATYHPADVQAADAQVRATRGSMQDRLAIRGLELTREQFEVVQSWAVDDRPAEVIREQIIYR